jgi:hypothetical protein
MNDKTRKSPISRVLIVLDAPLQKLDMLETAISLAANRQVELAALFIEDQNLFHLASLPFAQEIDRTSARERKLDSILVARTLRSQAHAISLELDRLAKRFRINHSLKIVRGSYLSTVLSAMTGMDVVFLSKEIGSYKKRFRTQPADVLRTTVRLARKHNAVWVIYNGSTGSNRALSTAHDIALAENRDLVILLHAPTEDDAVKLRQQSDLLLKDRAVKTLYTFFPGSDDNSLIRLLLNSECGLIVIHRNGEHRSDTLTSLFLRELECPVVLVQ